MPRDRRRLHNPPQGPRPRELPRPVDVTVVGGGLAGIAAATVLAERGAQVTVIEREAFLGGRAGAWTETLADGARVEMERGFHAFFRHYYNVRALLRRIDPELQRLRPLGDYPLYGPEGLRESFAGLPRTPILNLLALIRRSPNLRLRDALKVDDTLGQAMMAHDPEGTLRRYDHMSAGAYLDRLGFPPRARQMLFDVFAHSFFNPEEDFSAAELIAMMHFYFLGNPEGIVFDVIDGPFSTRVWEPLRRHLEGLGVRFRLGEAVRSIAREGGRWRIEHGGGESASDAVVVGVTVPALQAIVRASPSLGDPTWRAAVAGLGVTLPFAVWRLWLDRPVDPGRPPFVGTTGLGLLDNISLYHLFEDESRAWAARSGGAVVELHAYAVPEGLEEAAIRDDLLGQLHALYPETRGATIVDERFLLRRDCPAFRPGEGRARPTVTTPEPGLYLAGDFVQTPFPSALMERAVASGFLAANQILAEKGAAEEPIWTIRPRGLLARWIYGATSATRSEPAPAPSPG
ncbi:MAG: FAD-dependent oxidoreductase [Myxococcales bacterium]|nr:FAD-dependent oxidoreductase [Myxococcales bacterium]MCB9704861.1 FAD-dependent oxidoreductase [Myxococcales bacterium]